MSATTKGVHGACFHQDDQGSLKPSAYVPLQDGGRQQSTGPVHLVVVYVEPSSAVAVDHNGGARLLLHD